MNPRVTAVPYDMALPRPIITAHGVYDRRQGFIILLQDADGHIGAGDASPLCGFSNESVSDLEDAIGLLLHHQRNSSGGIDLGSMTVPSLQFALGSALADLKAQREKLSVARMLNPDSAGQVTINGLLGDGSPDQMVVRGRSLWQEGYRIFKVKVGAGTAQHDVMRLTALLQAIPDAKLRLDANAAWDERTAVDVLTHFPRESVDFMEQPLAVGKIKESQRLCSRLGLPLALDEDILTIEAGMRIVDANACDAIVVKPMVLGSYSACHGLSQMACDRGIRVVYTSSWETDIGIAATLQLAAALGDDVGAMGLSTAGTLAHDLLACPLLIKKACLHIPDGPGLGLSLAPALLAHLD